MTLSMNLGENSYDIVVRRGVLREAAGYLKLDRRVLIVTDDGVPAAYSDTIAEACKYPIKVSVPAGEGSKSFPTFERLCRVMLEKGFTRTDAVVAVGGGVVGDLAGFAAASYMRGIDFYNIPTTFLSQVDSSIGGKTAINLEGVKNIIGAFYQPKKVLIDPEALRTLPQRQLSSGLAESVKMAATFDKELFEMIEHDEKEAGLRRVLNFGHTIGHGIESCEGLHGLYHGECVALGMLPMCSAPVRERLTHIYEKIGLPTALDFDPERVFEAVTHDKKLDGNLIHLVFVPEIGTYEMKTMTLHDFHTMIKEAFSS